MERNPDVDQMVADAVRDIRDRFGPEGLRDLVALATEEIDRSERVVAGLGESTGRPEESSVPTFDAADTQAWIAYTGREPGYTSAAEGED